MSGSIHAPGTGVNEFQPYKKIPTEGKDTWEATSDSTSSGRDWDTMVTEFEKSIFSFAKDDLESDSETSDGGSISLGEIAGHFTKGIGLTFTSMLKHWGQSLGFSLAFGTLLTFAPTLAVPLAAGGTILGGLKMIGAAAKIVASDTKRDTRLAWQSMGSGLLTFLPSFIGCKAAVKTAGKYGVELSKPADELGAWGSFKECCKLSVGIKPAGSKGILDIAKTTSLSKLKDIFLISESKPGNGEFQKAVEEARTQLNNQETTKKGELSTEEGKLTQAQKDELRAKNAYETIDSQIEHKQNQVENLQTEYDRLSQISKEAYQREIDEQVAKINDQIYHMDASNTRLNEMQTRGTGRIDPGALVDGSGMSLDRQASIAFNRRQITELRARDYDVFVTQEKNRIAAEIQRLNNEISAKDISRIDAKRDWDTAISATRKAQEKVDEAKKALEIIKTRLKNLTKLTEDNPDLRKLIKELKDCEDKIIFSEADENWKTTAAGGTKKKIIIGPDSNRDKLLEAINNGDVSLTASAESANCMYGSLENIDVFIKNYRSAHPKVNFWSANTPLWDGLFTTTKGYALFGAGIGDKRHE